MNLTEKVIPKKTNDREFFQAYKDIVSNLKYEFENEALEIGKINWLSQPHIKKLSQFMLLHKRQDKSSIQEA